MINSIESQYVWYKRENRKIYTGEFKVKKSTCDSLFVLALRNVGYFHKCIKIGKNLFVNYATHSAWNFETLTI